MRKAKPSILLILTDQHLRQILSSRFEKEGWHVEHAERAEDGERKAVKLRPSIFFVDARLVENVTKAMKHWRGLPTLMKAKIVILIPSSERSHIDEALAAGADQAVLEGSLAPKEIVRSFLKLLTS